METTMLGPGGQGRCRKDLETKIGSGASRGKQCKRMTRQRKAFTGLVASRQRESAPPARFVALIILR